MISPEIPEAGFQEESLFHAARQLSDAVAQEAFLEAACRNQPELRRRLDALLAAERAASRLLDGLLLQPRPHANLAVGGRLGDYELLGEIGRGGMGMVYRARQISTGRVVALKVIGSGSAAPTARISRFQIEAQAASQLTHPNIVRILEVGSCDGVWFFSMELIEGEALSERIKREASQKPTAGLADNHAFRDESVLIEQFCTIVHAVQYAHERGVLHRDLKPANILVDQAGEPHLIDFGLAKVLLQDGSPTRTADVMGTPSHMAPEQARGRSCSVETDVYGLGAILYELLTGRPPFHADSPVETLRQVIEQAPVHPSKFAPGVDASLALICLRCLEKEPRHRYPSAAALAADLERWLRHESILTRRASLLVRAGRWARRNPLAASFIATLAVGLGVMGGLLLQVNREKNKQAALAAELRSMNRESVRLLERAVGMVRENLESLWAKGERTSMLVGSEEIAALANRPVPTSPLNVSPTRYVLGLTAEESPTGRAQRLADLLAHLENQLGHQLRRPVRMDVRFYKFVSDCRADLCAGKLDIARLGALPYLRSRGEVPELQPIVVPIKEAKIATLFSRADSDIKSVDDLRGRRVAFGETNSTVSFRAQMELAQRGLTASQLAGYDFLDASLEFEEDVKMIGLDEARKKIGYLHSHAQVIEGVLSGRYDAGVAAFRALQINHSRGLAAIPGSEFVSSRSVWVARAGLDGKVVQALRKSMTALQGEPWLGMIPDHPTGFELVTDESFASEQAALARMPVLFPTKPFPRSSTASSTVSKQADE